MENKEVEVGDVVCLKSGGPLMTVGKTGDQEAICVWFDESKLEEATFPIKGLRVKKTEEAENKE